MRDPDIGKLDARKLVRKSRERKTKKRKDNKGLDRRLGREDNTRNSENKKIQERIN